MNQKKKKVERTPEQSARQKGAYARAERTLKQNVRQNRAYARRKRTPAERTSAKTHAIKKRTPKGAYARVKRASMIRLGVIFINGYPAAVSEVGY